MIQSANLGYPRIGKKRELKRALESYWRGKIDKAELKAIACSLRRHHWEKQQVAGLDYIPSNDFSFYDHVLDTAAIFGVIPERFHPEDGEIDLDTYFTMARGGRIGGEEVTAMEMTKWFDTNYHYIVPEFTRQMEFQLAWQKPVEEFKEAEALGINTRPVLLGPISFLLLGKTRDDFNPLILLDRFLPVYRNLLEKLHDAGADWVQIDEPCLVLDLDEHELGQYHQTFAYLNQVEIPSQMLTTYFGSITGGVNTIKNLPVDGVHLDLVRAPNQLEAFVKGLPGSMRMSLGIIDGRNVWKANLEKEIAQVRAVAERIGQDRVQVAPSSSLLFVPVDVNQEPGLDEALKEWFAFAEQKLHEVALIARAGNEGKSVIASELSANRSIFAQRSESQKVHHPEVQQRLREVSGDMYQRDAEFNRRKSAQQAVLDLPQLPSTSIGSLPQTREVRRTRAKFNRGELSREDYDSFLQNQIIEAIAFQEEIGMDVLVHGEFERSDMVEYFGQRMEGFAFTKHGWVQSYGSRCVRPPIIYGDVSRPEPMTVRWSSYAQSLTGKPVKGMVTGPVTILQWSFVRNDQPRKTTCQQIALAMRDEVIDLENAGIPIIQIDEPALREGLPLKRENWDEYLEWAVGCFKLASSGVADATQIHTHMCYAEFNDIIESIGRMDADTISIESTRSQMELLDAFTDYNYPNDIGPGVYDIHSPRIPEEQEIVDLLEKALDVLEPDQVWVNPDCGLKTRNWKEVKPSLEAMVNAATRVRSALAAKESVTNQGA